LLFNLTNQIEDYNLTWNLFRVRYFTERQSKFYSRSVKHVPCVGCVTTGSILNIVKVWRHVDHLKFI
jgi:hypothetical protein